MKFKKLYRNGKFHNEFVQRDEGLELEIWLGFLFPLKSRRSLHKEEIRIELELLEHKFANLYADSGHLSGTYWFYRKDLR